MPLGRRGPQNPLDTVAALGILGLEHDLGRIGPDARADPVLIDDMEVGEDQQLVGWRTTEVAGADQERGPDPVAHALVDGRDRGGPVEAGLPPAIGLGSLAAQHRLELALVERSVAP